MMQKLMMTSMIIFVYRGTAIQVALAFFLTFSFLLAVMWYQPLVNKRLAKLQIFSLVITCLTLFLGLMKMSPNAYSTGGSGGGGGDSFADFFVFAMNILVLVLPFMQIIWDMEAIWLRLKGLLARTARMDKQNAKLSSSSIKSKPAASLKADKTVSSGADDGAGVMQDRSTLSATAVHDEDGKGVGIGVDELAPEQASLVCSLMTFMPLSRAKTLHAHTPPLSPDSPHAHTKCLVACSAS